MSASAIGYHRAFGRGGRASRVGIRVTSDADSAPMGEMNTTPLIDVMLVLLIMFIITVPVATHAVKLDLPGPHPPILPKVNDLAIDRLGTARWNGEAVGRGELRALLAASAAMPEEPELHLAPDADAPFVAVDSILADAKRANVHRMGFVGNADYAGVF